MTAIRQRPTLVLLALLLASHLALAAHGAMHASADSLTCEFCTGHANPWHAVPVAMPLPVGPVQAGFEAPRASAPPLLARTVALHVRGPPAVS